MNSLFENNPTKLCLAFTDMLVLEETEVHLTSDKARLMPRMDRCYLHFK